MSIAGLIVNLVNFILGLVELVLGLRLILRLLGANTATPFVNWIYETSEPLLAPFAGIFPAPRLETGSVLEFSTLFAILVYALLGYLLIALMDALNPDTVVVED